MIFVELMPAFLYNISVKVVYCMYLKKNNSLNCVNVVQ